MDFLGMHLYEKSAFGYEHESKKITPRRKC